MWDLDAQSCLQGLLNGHRGPVTEFTWRESLAVSGDRTGILAFWDINRPEPVRMTKGHGSAVSKICFASEGDDRVLLTAGLGDGRVNVFDMRTSQLVKAAVVAKAAINFLDMANHSNGNHIVTGSADHMIKLFDMRAGEGKNLSRVR